MNLNTLFEGAIKELDWALDHGAKVILVRPAPVVGRRSPRSPFLPEFDPFWARVEEAGVRPSLHASDSGYQQYANRWLGRGDSEFLAFQPDAFSMASSNGTPAAMDTVISAVCHGTPTRHPEVKMATVESGSTWLPLCRRGPPAHL